MITVSCGGGGGGLLALLRSRYSTEQLDNANAPNNIKATRLD